MTAAALALAAGGCTDADRTASAQPRPSTDGPLRTSLDGGGNSLDRPRTASSSWTATFGSLLVCSEVPVTLTAAEAGYRSGAPAEITFRVRTVPAAAERTGRQVTWAPLGARATPLEELLERQVSATAVTDLEGTTVASPCAAGADAPYTEIITSMAVDDAGTWVDSLRLTYEADGTEYVLPVNWNYVACGEAITDPTVCGDRP